jgi:transcriptional regulator with XRE-family HTH domain
VEHLEQFAENLRVHRHRRHLSQEALGEASLLHRTEVGLLERRERDPQLATIVKLARGLEIEPGELLAEIR